MFTPCAWALHESESNVLPSIVLTNYADGTEIRFPAPLLRGILANIDLDSVTVINQSSTRETRIMPAEAYQGQFKALTELVPGKNRLLIRAGTAELTLNLTYTPQTNPYRVTVIYFTDSSGSTEYQTPLGHDAQNFRDKLDTAMKLMQTFTAESLNDQGYGRATFNLEIGEDGKVPVIVVKGSHPVEYYRKLCDTDLSYEIGQELDKQLCNQKYNALIFTTFAWIDKQSGLLRAYSARGGMNYALNSHPDLFTWPGRLQDVQKVFSDSTALSTECRIFKRDDQNSLPYSTSGYKDTFWAAASTSMGISLHELGHTFGLNHSSWVFDIMNSWGIDHFNRFFSVADPPSSLTGKFIHFPGYFTPCWSPESAFWLKGSKFFFLDQAKHSSSIWQTMPVISLDNKWTITVKSGSGVRAVNAGFYKSSSGCLIFHDSDSNSQEVKIPIFSIGRWVIDPAGGPGACLSLSAQDFCGNYAVYRDFSFDRKQLLDELHKPWLRRWQTASVDHPCNDTDFTEEVSLTTDEVQKIEDATATSQLRDWAEICPCENSIEAGRTRYLLRTITTEKPWNLNVYTCGCSSIMAWFNGGHFISACTPGEPSPQFAPYQAHLKVGENRLLVRCMGVTNDYGCFIRLESSDGTCLNLTDEGRLVPVF